jgi:Cupin-like domain
MEDLLFDSDENHESIEEVYKPSRKIFLEKYYKLRKPVLMRGVTESWPATKKWNLNFFKNLGPSDAVQIEIGNILQGKTVFDEWTLGYYLNHIHERTKGTDPERDASEDVPYLAAFRLFSCYPELKNDVDFSFWDGMIKYPVGWIGPSGAYSGIHWDIAPNLFAGFLGIKEFRIYSPNQSEFLYQSEKYDKGSFLSLVDGQRPDYNRFPLFKKARPIKVTVHPGDLLFIPEKWWHEVLGIGTTISVSCFAFDIKGLFMGGLPGLFKYYFHCIGMYKKGNCTCHKAGRGQEQ